MRVRLSAFAEHDLQSAIDFYEQQRNGLGAEFLEAVRRLTAEIGEWPLAGRLFASNFRGRVVRPFPYWVIYEQLDSSILITAVAHQRRNPDYWRSRWEVREPATEYLPLAA